MIFFLIICLLLLAQASAQGSGCPSGAHIIVARGSLEPQGPGIMGEISAKLLHRIPGSDMESLVYPARYAPYVPSQTAGVEAMTDLLLGYAKKCPKTKMIVLGFSQGAHVTMDVMCGASSDGFPDTVPQSSLVAGNTIVLMGDPSLTVGQPFLVGSSHGSGIFPRHNPGGCQLISEKTISICDSGDPFCEAGSHDLAVHMAYVKVWGEYAANHTITTFYSAQR